MPARSSQQSPPPAGPAGDGPARPRPARRAGPHDAVRRQTRGRLLALGLLVLSSLVLAPLATHVASGRLFVVASGSMEPGIPKGSLVAVSPGDIEAGTVVVYEAVDGTPQVHRVVEVRRDDGATRYLTRGDANDGADSYLVPEEDVLGVVRWDTPHVGRLWLLPGGLPLILFACFLLVYLAITVWDGRAWLLHGRPAYWLAAACVLVVLALLVPATLGAVLLSHTASSHAFGAISSRTPLAAGSAGSAAVAADQNSATATIAAPRLWKEYALWYCVTTDPGCVNTITTTSYTDRIGSRIRIDAADYAPAPTFRLEATLKAGAGGTTYAILRDVTNGVDITASEVSTSSTTATLLQGASFTLSGSKEYMLRVKYAGAQGEIHSAKLVFSQDYPTKTLELVRISGGHETTSDSPVDNTRSALWRYDAAAYDGVQSIHFESVGRGDGATAEVWLVDAADGSTVTTVTHASSSTSSRVRSADIKSLLVDGHEYHVRLDRDGGFSSDDVYSYATRIAVVQSGFTKTARHVELAWWSDVTATSFVDVGYDGRAKVDDWSGTAYFDVTTGGDAGGITKTLRLRDDTNGAAVTGSTVTATSGSQARARSGAIQLDPGSTDYSAQAQVSSGTGRVRMAWLVVFQESGAASDPLLWKEIPMWHCLPGFVDCVTATSSTTYSEALRSRVNVPVGSYSPTPTFYFEATLKAGTGATAYAVLKDATTGVDVGGSEVSTTATTPTLVRSPPITLTGDKDYTFKFKSNGVASIELTSAKIVLSQAGFGSTVEQVRIAGGGATQSLTLVDNVRTAHWRYDAAGFDGVTGIHFEANLRAQGGGTASAALVDVADGAVVSTLSTTVTGTSGARLRSADIKGSLVDGHEYKVQIKTTLASAFSSNSYGHVVVFQSAFTKTMRYSEVGWAADTTSTAFVDIPDLGRYHAASEWAGAAYFEATLLDSAGTATAQLADAGSGAAVAGSAVGTASATATRVRSAALTLAGDDVTYKAQLKASAGTASLRMAWVIVFQQAPPAHDPVLLARNTVTSACTWSFTLAATSTSNLARLDEASVRLRAGASEARQVAVAGGALAQSTGSGVAVAHPGDLDIVARGTPLSAGTSTVAADLKATCAGHGIHTVQPLEFVFA